MLMLMGCGRISSRLTKSMKFSDNNPEESPQKQMKNNNMFDIRKQRRLKCAQDRDQNFYLMRSCYKSMQLNENSFD